MIQVATEDIKGTENDKLDLTEKVFAHQHHALFTRIIPFLLTNCIDYQIGSNNHDHHAIFPTASIKSSS